MSAVNYGRIALIPQGDFKGNVQYEQGDVVSYAGSSYMAKSKPPVATLPTDTEYWQLAARGFDAENAKNVTAEDKQALGFSNVQGFIDLTIEKLFNFTIDLDEIDRAFLSVFTHVSLEEPTATAMSAEDIQRAINTPWNGESSNDPNALNKEEIEEAMNTEWNGESSTDHNALSKEEINEAIANASK